MLFLGEQMSVLQAIGIFLVMFGAICPMITKKENSNREKSDRP